jgi:hypothetical protein
LQHDTTPPLRRFAGQLITSPFFQLPQGLDARSNLINHLVTDQSLADESVHITMAQRYPMNNTFSSLPFGTPNEHSLAENATVDPSLLEHSPSEEISTLQNQESRDQRDEPATGSRGSVILLHWQEDENRELIMSLLDRLAKVFQEVFRFDTEIWAIPYQNCHTQVNIKILEFAQKSGRDNLLIVYYAGLGKLTDHYQLEWVRYV